MFYAVARAARKIRRVTERRTPPNLRHKGRVTLQPKGAKTPRNTAFGVTNMADHQHGEMDITAQERAFNGFIKWVKNGVIVCICILIFLAIFNS